MVLKNDKTYGAWLIFTATAFGVFMSALDAGIVVIALPTMAQDFSVNLPIVQWVLSAYLLTISVFLPLAGRLGDLYSCRWVFMIGLGIFTVASALCGMSQTMEHLIAARVAQAIGAALMMALGPAIIMRAFPGKERGRALGFSATIVALGLLAGPGLGGLLIARFGWPFIFFVNVPVGILGFILCQIFLPREQATGGEKLDIAGAVLFTVGMSALLVGISHGNDWGWWAWPVATSGAISALSLGTFYIVERRAPSPIIDLNIISHPRFLLPSLAALTAYMAMYTINILLPFYLHQKLVITPELMGMLLTVAPVIIVVVSPISGWLSEKIQPSYLAATGLLIIAVGLVAQSQLGDTSTLWRIALGQIVIGLGFGLFSSPNNNTILSSAPLEKSGLAGGLLALTRNLGMVCGIAMATSIFETVNALTTTDGKTIFYPGFGMTLLVAANLALVAALFSMARAWMGEEASSHHVPAISLENHMSDTAISHSTMDRFTNALAKGFDRLTRFFKNKTDALSYPPGRLMSMDAFRGFIMFWILGGDVIAQSLHKVSNSRFIEILATQLEHKDWEGFYFYDLIFPSFIFIVGVSIVFSISKIIKNQGKRAALKKILMRSLLLYVVGVIYYGGFSKLWPDIRLLGVLQRIAICYLAAGVLFCFFKPRVLFGISVVILVGYWALLSFVPFPDVRPAPGMSMDVSRETGFEDGSQLNLNSETIIHGVYKKGVNLANYIDQKYLPGFKWDGSWDPEGILSTMPAIVTCIIGVLVGLFLKEKSVSEPRKLKLLIASGVLFILVGLLWNLQFPMIKKIWTSSYVLVAGGFSILFFSFFYYLLDFKKWIYWAIPFIWIGTNSLTVYLADNFLDFHKLATFIAGGDIKNYLDQTVTEGFGDLVLAIISLLLAILFCRFLYKKARGAESAVLHP